MSNSLAAPDSPRSWAPLVSPRSKVLKHAQSLRSVLPEITDKRTQKSTTISVLSARHESQDIRITVRRRKVARSTSDSVLFTATAQFASTWDLAPPEAVAEVFRMDQDRVKELKRQHSTMLDKINFNDKLDKDIKELENADESADEEILSPKQTRKPKSSKRSRSKKASDSPPVEPPSPSVEDPEKRMAGKRRRSKSRDEKELQKIMKTSSRRSSLSSSSPSSSKSRSPVPKLRLSASEEPVSSAAEETDFERPASAEQLSSRSKSKDSPRLSDTPPSSNSPRRPRRSEAERVRNEKIGKTMRRACTRKLLQEDPNELVYEDDDQGKPVLVAGTVDQLVSMLTVRLQDFNLLRSFLLCKEHFISSEELLGKLIDVFDKASRVLEDDQQRDYVRMRVINVIKKWLNFNVNDFRDNRMVEKLSNFIDQMHNGDVKERGWADVLQNAHETTFNYREYIEQTFSLASIEGAPKPIVSKTILHLELAASNRIVADPNASVSGMLKMLLVPTRTPAELLVLDIHPEELARQWTLIDQHIFRQIEFSELLNKNFEKAAKAKTIAAIQDRFNLVTGWIATQIVLAPTAKLRAKMITHFIQVGHKLLEMCNFHGAMAIVVGLTQTAVSRLRESWKKVSSMDKWKGLEQIMSPMGNWRALRTLHDNVAPPLIPTPMLYLKDLTFIEDGNDDWYDKQRKLISWEKIKLLGKVLTRIQLAQEVPYKFLKVNVIYNFLSEITTLSEEELEKQSKLREARSAEI